jgi:hypothetical protein
MMNTAGGSGGTVVAAFEAFERKATEGELSP